MSYKSTLIQSFSVFKNYFYAVFNNLLIQKRMSKVQRNHDFLKLVMFTLNFLYFLIYVLPNQLPPHSNKYIDKVKNQVYSISIK